MKEINPAEDSACINRTRSKSQTAITFTAEPIGSWWGDYQKFYICSYNSQEWNIFCAKKEEPTFSRGIFYERL